MKLMVSTVCHLLHAIKPYSAMDRVHLNCQQCCRRELSINFKETLQLDTKYKKKILCYNSSITNTENVKFKKANSKIIIPHFKKNFGLILGVKPVMFFNYCCCCFHCFAHFLLFVLRQWRASLDFATIFLGMSIHASWIH